MGKFSQGLLVLSLISRGLDPTVAEEVSDNLKLTANEKSKYGETRMIFVETDGILQERSDGRQSRAGISQWPSAPLVTSSLQNFLPTSGTWKQSFSMRIIGKSIVSHAGIYLILG